MYKIACVFLLFLLFQQDEVMVWDEPRRLNWNDFQDKPDYAREAVAITASGIQYSYSAQLYSDRVEYTTNVEAQFFPKDSWYKREFVNDTILGHEQLHFDLTELYARKLRKEIAYTQFTKDIKKEIKAIYVRVSKALGDAQNQYDAQTDYSRDYPHQKRWEDSIKIELNKYKAYE